MTPLAYVVACASDYGAVVSDVTQADARLTLEVGNADQKKTVFRLSVSEIGSLLSIRERVPEHIPSFCPERHINSDGTFCLGWSESGSHPIYSVEDAHRWWNTILQFLRLQIRSERLKRWPGQEWAHGDAALHQHRAEELCKSLGPNFTDGLHKKTLKVRLTKTRDGRKLIRFEMNEQHLYSVWMAQGRVTNGRQACVCTKGDVKRHCRLRSCATHLQDAAQLAMELMNWQEAEQRFWKHIAGKPCCGRIKTCQLKQCPLTDTENAKPTAANL